MCIGKTSKDAISLHILMQRVRLSNGELEFVYWADLRRGLGSIGTTNKRAMRMLVRTAGAMKWQTLYTRSAKAGQSCYRECSCTGDLLEAITALPASGRVLLLITTGMFVVSLMLGFAVQRSTKPVMELLIKSIRRSEDFFIEAQGVVQEIRGSYRLKLSKLESIDTTSLVAAHLNKWYVLRIGGYGTSFQQVSAFLSTAPSYLVTLGLIGTFLGLIENLSELSGLIGASNSTDMSGLLGSMGTAFTVSLFGVSFSLVLWLWEHLLGIDTIDDRLISLIGAYLDGVVQHDVKRYSLVGEAVSRIETYLSEFLANFTDRVGSAIDAAMRDKLDEVFDIISKMARVSAKVIAKMDEGATRYEASSILFKDASDIVTKPNLGQSVVLAAEKLASLNQRLADSVENMTGDLLMTRDALNTMNDLWAQRAEFFAKTLARNQELLAGSITLAERVETASIRFTDSVTVIEEVIPSLKDSISTSSVLRGQAQDLISQAQASTSSLVQASDASARSASAVAAGTEELKSAVTMLSEAVRELRLPNQDSQTLGNR